ncbi:MAG: MFS transporter [Candidatus Tenebribacter davisii]|jgi:fucose permease|nr:MFS transporter [Candidatus Tenebribacter davisii]
MDKDRKIRVLILAQMIALSMAAVSIPALITTFQKEYDLSIAQSAIIPIISTLGGFITNVIIASVSARLGLKRLNLYFLLISLFASILLAFSSNIYLFLIGITLIGISTAFGLTNTSTIFAHIKLKYQNYGVFHAFFGIGGIITPAVISVLLKHEINYRYFYYLLVVMFIGFIAYVASTSLIENRKYDNIKFKEAFSIIRKSFVLPVLIIIIFQAGSEQGIVMWSGNLLSDAMGHSVQFASLMLSFYWIVFTISRLMIQFMEKLLGKLNSAKLSSILSIVFLVLLLLSSKPIFFVLLAAAMAPTFPLMQKYSVQKLPPREVGLFNGMVFAFASIGNVIISGSMGVIGDHSINYSYLIPIFCAVVILAITFYLSALKKSGKVKVSPK